MKRLASMLVILLFLFTPYASASPVKNFSFKDIYGKTHKFSDFRGKWVIVNYWAPSCQPCIAEIPALRTIAHHYRDRVVVLGMDAGETSAAELRRFIRQHGINYMVAPTQDSTLFALGLIFGVPTTYIVAPNGNIVTSHMGVMSVQQLQSYIHGRY